MIAKTTFKWYDHPESFFEEVTGSGIVTYRIIKYRAGKKIKTKITKIK